MLKVHISDLALHFLLTNLDFQNIAEISAHVSKTLAYIMSETMMCSLHLYSLHHKLHSNKTIIAILLQQCYSVH